ncbi:hypothetical protein [Parasedimentitalea huanghaiensis]|uniref:Uncharacterized protein n=1 Tax=Parasedimentitalea huanghaiensis TaxID=2682100 RepID=A0A6L6WIV2_9RHOB|nr:hypothetical protein [Zongyanglinia huanghaiensis]MVO17108.1 hypothetical protein [Zongyanglinia huanghaiensis]
MVIRTILTLTCASSVLLASIAVAESACEGFLDSPAGTSLVKHDKITMGVDCLEQSIREFQEITVVLEEERASFRSKHEERFSTEIELMRIANSIPSGAVIAFDVFEGCAPGWTFFEAAGGRSIIGVDGKKYELPYKRGIPDYQIGGS